jgi:DNA-directed RNA polymerase subunit N (RpoN/RPB10)
LKDAVIISNDYDRYHEIIKVLLKQDTILDELQQRVKTVWDRFFSSKVQAREMLKVIKEVI